MLEAQGKAYGDPLAALEVLEIQCQAAEADVGVLEARRKGLRAVQEKAEVNAGTTYARGTLCVVFQFGVMLRLFLCSGA